MKLTKGKVISALLALLLVLLALFPIPATSESGTEEQAAIEITIPDEEPPEEPEVIQIELDVDDDEPAQEEIPEIQVSLEENEDDLPDVEESADELVIEDIQITEEAPEEPAQLEEEPADLAGVIAAHGYAYAATAGETKVYGSSDLAEDQHVFTIAGGQPLLATACIDSETHSSVKVWFIMGTGEAMTGYVPAQSLEEAPLDVDEANAVAAYGSGYVDSEAGILLAFIVQGSFPQTMEETAPDEIVVEDVQIPDEEESTAIEVVQPDEQEDEPIPAEPEITEEHEEIPDSKQMLAEIGDFAYVTTNTRAFMEVDESAADDYYGDYFLGYFLKDAAVQVEDVMTDFLGRAWYSVSYIYGPDEGDGLTCEIVGMVYVLAEETAQTDLVERTATDYGYPPDYFRPMLLSSFYVDLEDHYGGVASFYVGESGLHATTGHDNEYMQSPFRGFGLFTILLKGGLSIMFDFSLAFPPCTYLTVTGNRWFNVEKYGEKAVERHNNREKAIQFFLAFANADCKKIAIENPVGIMSTRYKKPTQIIQPYMFGNNARKKLVYG